MARTSSIAKDNKKPKFSSRQHNRCKLCGRPRAFYASSVFAGCASADWLYAERFLGL